MVLFTSYFSLDATKKRTRYEVGCDVSSVYLIVSKKSQHTPYFTNFLTSQRLILQILTLMVIRF